MAIEQLYLFDSLPQEIPVVLLERARRWNLLKRWERRDLGQSLRRLGLSFGEIQTIIPVPKGTLSGWCRDILRSTHPQSGDGRSAGLDAGFAVGRRDDGVLGRGGQDEW